MSYDRTASTQARIFCALSVILLVIGVLFVYSASSVFALEQCGSSTYFLKKQLIGLLIGCLAALIMRIMPIGLIRLLSPLAFWFTLILTAITLIPQYAVKIHGSNRWLNLGGFSFQPSELLKIAFILYIAHLLSKKERYLDSLIRGYAPFLLILGITSVILLEQPDFGLTITLAATTFTLLFIARARLWHLLATAAAVIPVIALLILYKPYRLKRIVTFMNPWADPQGAGFQIIQSLIAIGSGGWWGVGIGNSKQKFFYLPMQHTDFIFSIIAEEVGFIGVSVIIAIFILLLYTGIKLALRLHNSFSHYTVLGFVILITLQALINLAVTTGLAPTKGIGLPFISYGNTALVCTMGMLGLICNMAHNNNK